MGGMRVNTAMSYQATDTASSETVTFKMGDSLQKIADSNNVDLKDLMAENHITNPTAVLPGQEIRIPKKNYAATEPSGVDPSAPRQVSPAPNAGSVDAKSMAELKIRQATIDGLVQKATSAGLGPGDIALIASLGTRLLSPKDFHGATAAVQQALSSANPRGAMAQLGPKIIQGSGKEWVAEGTVAMANRTGHMADSFRLGSLKDVEEVTVVAHGNETAIQIGDKILSPRQFAEALRDAGWEGGTVRLVACKTAGANATFAKDLASELNKLGMDSAVIAPTGKVTTLSGDLGMPRVVAAGKTLQAPGKGWEIITDDAPEVAAQAAKAGGNTVTTAGRGVGAVGEGLIATEEAGGAVAGARVFAGEALGFAGFMLEPLEMMGNYFGSFEEAKNALKSRGYTDGFSQGVAAGMAGVPQDSVRERFGREVANSSMGERLVGAEGVEDRYHNKGLVEGYKYFQSLPPEKQERLRDAATANGWDLKRDDVTELQRGVRPMVVDMFQKAAEAQEKAEYAKIRKMYGWE